MVLLIFVATLSLIVNLITLHQLNEIIKTIYELVEKYFKTKDVSD